MAKPKTAAQKRKEKAREEQRRANEMAKGIVAAFQKKGGPRTKGRHVFTEEGPGATKRGKQTPKSIVKRFLSPFKSYEPKITQTGKDMNIITRTGEGGEETYPSGQQYYLEQAQKRKDGGIMKAGKEYSVEEVGDETYGIDEIPTEWGRKKLNKGTEQLIKGSEFQVRGRYFNNNNGKGTF